MGCKNFKQGDSRWRNNPYAANTMAGAGCGPTACADVIGSINGNITPVSTANWLTDHGYAIAHNGTSWYGIGVCIDAYGLDATQLNSASQYGKRGSSYEKRWKELMATGDYWGILLMGKGNFTKGGHYICITQWDGSRAYVHDPATSARDGWHPWSHFDGDVKVFYVIKKKEGSVSEDISDASKRQNIKTGQAKANEFCEARLAVDGIAGPITQEAKVKVLQHAMNLDYEAELKEDGIAGPKTLEALRGHTVRKGETQYMVTALEILLLLNGYDPNGVEYPGVFGNGLEAVLESYQDNNGLAADCIAGYNTFVSLIS